MGKAPPIFVSALTGPVGKVEPAFLHDVPTDNLVGAILALSAELWVMRDRQGRLERLLESAGVVASEALETAGQSPEESAAATVAAERFAERILGELVRGKTPISTVGRSGRLTDPIEPTP